MFFDTLAYILSNLEKTNKQYLTYFLTNVPENHLGRFIWVTDKTYVNNINKANLSDVFASR